MCFFGLAKPHQKISRKFRPRPIATNYHHRQPSAHRRAYHHWSHPLEPAAADSTIFEPIKKARAKTATTKEPSTPAPLPRSPAARQLRGPLSSPAIGSPGVDQDELLDDSFECYIQKYRGAVGGQVFCLLSLSLRRTCACPLSLRRTSLSFIASYSGCCMSYKGCLTRRHTGGLLVGAPVPHQSAPRRPTQLANSTPAIHCQDPRLGTSVNGHLLGKNRRMKLQQSV